MIGCIVDLRGCFESPSYSLFSASAWADCVYYNALTLLSSFSKQVSMIKFIVAIKEDANGDIDMGGYCDGNGSEKERKIASKLSVLLHKISETGVFGEVTEGIVNENPSEEFNERMRSIFEEGRGK